MSAPPLGPGDAQAVFDCLQACISQDTHVQKQAEAALLDLGPRPGFCSCLAEIILSKDADHSARWLAAVHFKNSITKYWRARLPGSLSDEEKAHLRTRLLPLLDQEDSQIAIQTAVVLAKVARLDFPRSWPSLFTEILCRLQEAATAGRERMLTVRRCYLALHHTLKELASKRLAADQRAFESVTEQLLEPLWNQWTVDTSTLIAELPRALENTGNTGSTGNTVLLTFERWLLELKCLRRMLIFGSPSDAKTLEAVPAVAKTATALVDALRALLTAAPPKPCHIPPGPPRTQLGVMLERGCIKLTKTIRQIAEIHPWTTFHSGALMPALDVCCNHLMAPSMTSTSSTATAIIRNCLLTIHMAVKCPSYRGSTASLTLGAGKGKELTTKLKQMAAEVQPHLTSFWATRQRPLIELIVMRMFPLSPKELEMWEDSGEEFHAEMEHNAQEESLRGCAEQAFVALLESNRDELTPFIMEMLQAVTIHTSGENRQSANGHGTFALLRPPAVPSEVAPFGVPWAIRVQAAVYHAVTVGAYELYDAVDLSTWLHTTLLREMQDASPSHRPVCRAAIKLIAAWASKLKRNDRPPVYGALVNALSDEDPAIHLAAAAALHAVVDDWEFEEAQFAEFVPHCFQLLAQLLHKACELEAQLEIFGLINLIVDRLGPSATAYAPGLLNLLPRVWEASEGQSLLRIQVLVALQRLIHVLGQDSPAAYPILIPVVSIACDPSQPDELNLLEDGLLLWLVALRHAPSPHSGLMAPILHLLIAMERSTEHIAIGARLLTSALLLGGPEAVAMYGPQIAHTLHGLIGNIKDKGMQLLLPVLDTIVQLDPANGPAVLAQPLVALLKDIHSGSEPAMVIAPAMNVFARILLLNPTAFLNIFQAAAGGQGPDATNALLLATLDIWLDKRDSVSTAAARKLSALGLCALLAAPVPGVLQRCEEIMAFVTGVWFELEGPDAGPEKLSVEYLALYAWTREDDLPLAVNIEEAEGEMKRRRDVFNRSPVGLFRLGAFCKQQLEAAAQVNGSDALNGALNALDPAIAGQLKQLVDGST